MAVFLVAVVVVVVVLVVVGKGRNVPEYLYGLKHEYFEMLLG